MKLFATVTNVTMITILQQPDVLMNGDTEAKRQYVDEPESTPTQKPVPTQTEQLCSQPRSHTLTAPLIKRLYLFVIFAHANNSL